MRPTLAVNHICQHLCKTRIALEHCGKTLILLAVHLQMTQQQILRQFVVEIEITAKKSIQFLIKTVQSRRFGVLCNGIFIRNGVCNAILRHGFHRLLCPRSVL